MTSRKSKSPKDHPTFVRQWNTLIDEISGRENFKRGHLSQLEILCDLYVEYETLMNVLETKGYTFESFGRNGLQIHNRPEVAQLNRTRTEIRNYSKMLGILLYKDKSTSDDEEVDEWS